MLLIISRKEHTVKIFLFIIKILSIYLFSVIYLREKSNVLFKSVLRASAKNLVLAEIKISEEKKQS